MSLYYQDAAVRVYHGHVLDELAGLEPESVHSIVTSPPYWSLRDYGVEPTVWGGVPAGGHEHEWMEGIKVHKGGAAESYHSAATIGREAPAERNKVQTFRAGESCACGAWRGHFGLEPLPDCLAWARGGIPCPRCFICHLRVVAAALWRVLRKDGTFWLNLADCYVDGGRGEDTYGPAGGLDGGRANRAESRKATMRQDYKDLRGKNLVGIPARAALALQADGWIYRRDIIWRKPNPMPESALDRPTSAHEYIFLFAKSRFYFYDNEAVREPVTGGAHARAPKGQPDPKAQQSFWNRPRTPDERTVVDITGITPARARELGQTLIQGADDFEAGARSPNMPAGWATGNGSHRELKGRYTSGQTERKERAFVPGAGELGVAGARAHVSAGVPWTDEGLGRNMRSVWDISTKPFPGAHFATFPPEIPERCIMAGTSERGCCRFCGAPWERVVDRSSEAMANGPGAEGKGHPSTQVREGHDVRDGFTTTSRTIGWTPTCLCRGQRGRTVPAVVLDPFGGAFTTALVAKNLGRHAVSIELKLEYLVDHLPRLAQHVLL